MFKSRSALESYLAQPADHGGGDESRASRSAISGTDGADGHLTPRSGVDGPGGQRALRLGEIADTRLVHLGAYPGGAASVAAAAERLLGGPLPDSPHAASAAGDHLLMRIAPDQYWVLGGTPGLDKRLRSAVPIDAGSVTSLEGARTRLLLEGAAARALLSRLVAIDLDPTVFPINGFAQTGIHHVGGLLLRASEDRYEFFALRTFAASTWEVVLDAARSFGYEIVLEQRERCK